MSEPKVNWLMPCTACNTDHYCYADCDKFNLLQAKYDNLLEQYDKLLAANTKLLQFARAVKRYSCCIVCADCLPCAAVDVLRAVGDKE